MLLVAATAPLCAAAPDASAILQGGDVAYRRALGPAASARKLNNDATSGVRARRIVTRLVVGAPAIDPAARDFAWAVNLVADPTPAVTVYPGGRLLVHDALLSQTGLADDEVAAILAHMIAHSLLGHDTARVVERAGADFTAADPNRRVLAVADASAAVLPSVRYTPEEIDAADRESVQLMARGGFDPRAAGSAWRRMRSARSIADRAPITEVRLATLDAAIRDAIPLYEDTRARAAGEAAMQRPPMAGPQRSIR